MKNNCPKSAQTKELRDELEKYDNDTLWNMLKKKIDPARAEEIHKNNKERVIRAIEMVKPLEILYLLRKEKQMTMIQSGFQMIL